MELYEQILMQAFSPEHIQETVRDLSLSAKDLIEMRSYQALRKIKQIIDDDMIEDDSCFEQIEQIICVFEEIGSNGGLRHDFG